MPRGEPHAWHHASSGLGEAWAVQGKLARRVPHQAPKRLGEQAEA